MPAPRPRHARATPAPPRTPAGQRWRNHAGTTGITGGSPGGVLGGAGQTTWIPPPSAALAPLSHAGRASRRRASGRPAPEPPGGRPPRARAYTHTGGRGAAQRGAAQHSAAQQRNATQRSPTHVQPCLVHSIASHPSPSQARHRAARALSVASGCQRGWQRQLRRVTLFEEARCSVGFGQVEGRTLSAPPRCVIVVAGEAGGGGGEAPTRLRARAPPRARTACDDGSLRRRALLAVALESLRRRRRRGTSRSSRNHRERGFACVGQLVSMAGWAWLWKDRSPVSPKLDQPGPPCMDHVGQRLASAGKAALPIIPVTLGGIAPTPPPQGPAPPPPPRPARARGS
eukprot:gene21781-biopygen13226